MKLSLKPKKSTILSHPLIPHHLFYNQRLSHLDIRHFTEMVIQVDGNASGLDEISADEWPSRLDCAQFSYANEPNPIATANTF
ncbi:hypothetical protein N9127_02595 [Akkermansiaceae bacterium]|nr:hypothetical protein [Akkermansiaceae bacterium]MDB4449929.1 hypothetical protein [Akkermansiaceae bacterium]MDB4556778.1 hypothetical protein [Akkermansiaceae bacterium]